MSRVCKPFSTMNLSVFKRIIGRLPDRDLQIVMGDINWLFDIDAAAKK